MARAHPCVRRLSTAPLLCVAMCRHNFPIRIGMDPPLQDRIVRLNVGGTLFMTTESTLTWPGPESFFATLLSGRMASRTDENGLKYKLCANTPR